MPIPDLFPVPIPIPAPMAIPNLMPMPMSQYLSLSQCLSLTYAPIGGRNLYYALWGITVRHIHEAKAKPKAMLVSCPPYMPL